MKRVFVFILMFAFVTSCAPSPEAIQKAIAQTQTAVPTSTSLPPSTQTPSQLPTLTPVPISLSELNLETILFKPGDLPSGFSVGEISKISSKQYKWVENHGVNNIHAMLERGGVLSDGSVSMFLYNSSDEVNEAYVSMVNSYGPSSIDNPVGLLNGVGEKATFVESNEVWNGDIDHQISITFTRCHAAVEITIFDDIGDVSLSSISTYATKLDERLQSLVCTTASSSSPSSSSSSLETIIGTWKDTRGFERVIVIKKVNEEYHETSTYPDGSGETITLGVKVINGEERLYENPDNLYGDYMVINNDGSLAFYDDQGFIYKISPDDNTKGSLSNNSDTSWFTGGTLHKSTVGEWRQATYANRLATSADLIAATQDVDYGNLSQFKQWATNLETCISTVISVGGSVDDEQVSFIAAICTKQLFPSK